MRKIVLLILIMLLALPQFDFDLNSLTGLFIKVSSWAINLVKILFGLFS